MSKGEIIKSEVRDFEVLGVKLPANVVIRAFPDDTCPDFDYGSKEDNNSMLCRFNTGELNNMVIVVEAIALGEQGQDNVGQCFIRSSSYTKDIVDLVNDNSMIENALTELEQNIVDKIKLFTDTFELNK